MPGYEPHEYAQVVQQMTPAEYEALKQDIAVNGLHTPVMLYDGKLLDGRHRQRACLELGMGAPAAETLPPGVDPVAYVLSANLHRRHLDASQRGWLAAQMTRLAPGRPAKNPASLPLFDGDDAAADTADTPAPAPAAPASGLSQAERAAMTGVSERQVRRADAIKEATGDLLDDAISGGNVSLDDAGKALDKARQQVAPDKVAERLSEGLALVESGDSMTLSKAVNALHNADLMRDPPPLPEGVWRTLVIDPPWPTEELPPGAYGDGDEGRQMPYPVMTVQDIAALPVSDMLANPGWLFLWTTQKYLKAAMAMVGHWGLTYRHLMVWQKDGGPRATWLPCGNVEFVIIASRGAARYASTRDFNLGFYAKRGANSEKPACFFETLARVTFPPRLSMFERQARPGFEVWGNEVNNDDNDDAAA